MLPTTRRRDLEQELERAEYWYAETDLRAERARNPFFASGWKRAHLRSEQPVVDAMEALTRDDFARAEARADAREFAAELRADRLRNEGA